MKTAFFQVSVAREQFQAELFKNWEVLNYGPGTEIKSASDALEVIVKKYADQGFKNIKLVQVTVG